jgi:hypothetical protein
MTLSRTVTAKPVLELEERVFVLLVHGSMSPSYALINAHPTAMWWLRERRGEDDHLDSRGQIGLRHQIEQRNWYRNWHRTSRDKGRLGGICRTARSEKTAEIKNVR